MVKLTCVRKGLVVRLKWKNILPFSIFTITTFLLLWIQVPAYLDSTHNIAVADKPQPKTTCRNCKKPLAFEEHPIIMLDYEAEIAADYDADSSTFVPPPSLPDSIYMKNLSVPRSLPDFSITPWKAMKRLKQPQIGKGCKHMKATKKHLGKWSLVIFVKSTSSNYDRRAAVRQTWGRIYFLNQIRVEKVFVIGQVEDPTVQLEIQAENEMFGDILQFEGPDDYKHMPIKVTSAMYWASGNLAKDDIYASTDDDFVVDLASVTDFLEYQIKLRQHQEKKRTGMNISKRNIRMNMPIYCVYYLDNVKGPDRNKKSKWFVSDTEYSLNRYPPYCGGGFYMMSVAMAQELYRLSRITKLLALDDVWVTGILRQKLRRGDDNVEKANWPLMWRATKKSEKLWKHLWGDYGRQKENVAKLLPEAWKKWEDKLNNRPHCIAEVVINKTFYDNTNVEVNIKGIKL